MTSHINYKESQKQDYSRFEAVVDDTTAKFVKECSDVIRAQLEADFGKVHTSVKGDLVPSFLYHYVGHTEGVVETAVSSAIWVNENNPDVEIFTSQQIGLIAVACLKHDRIQEGVVDPKDSKFKRNLGIDPVADPLIRRSNEFRSWKDGVAVMRDAQDKLGLRRDPMAELFTLRALRATFANYDPSIGNVRQPLVNTADPLQVIVALADLKNTYGDPESNQADVARLFLEENPLFVRYIFHRETLNETEEATLRQQILNFYAFQVKFVEGRSLFINEVMDNKRAPKVIKDLIDLRFNNSHNVAKALAEVRANLENMSIDEMLDYLANKAGIEIS
jgi:hypothetical protein